MLLWPPVVLGEGQNRIRDLRVRNEYVLRNRGSGDDSIAWIPPAFSARRYAQTAIAVNNRKEGAGVWILYALLSALFAALTSILAKIGIANVDSNLATAIRTAVVIVMAWGVVFLTGGQSGIADITRKSWVFLILSGCATGLSWLFYYKALQMGEASKVVPIDKFSVVISIVLAFLILGEPVDAQKIIGGILIAAGTFVLIL
jgi:transporter family protein